MRPQCRPALAKMFKTGCRCPPALQPRIAEAWCGSVRRRIVRTVTVIESRFDPSARESRDRRTRMEELVAELRERSASVAGGGGATVAANGTAREAS